MMLKGIDISKYQKGIKFNPMAGMDFCIVKATEGLDFTNTEFENQVEEFNRLLLGAYHFARPDIHGGTEGARAEAEAFLSAINRSHFLGQGILCLDYELPVGTPENNREWIYTFLEKIKDASGITPFLYSYYSMFIQLDLEVNNPLYPIWVADYRSKSLSTGGPKDIDWSIWQYTGEGTTLGYTGKVDMNWTKLSHDEWNSYTVPKEETVWQWAIRQGFFDKTDRRTETVTKEELAHILKNIVP